MNKRILLILISLIIIMTLFLGACTKATTSSSTTNSQPATSTPTTTAKPTSSTTVKPTTATTTAAPTSTVNKYGGTLKFIWNATAPLMGYPSTNSQPGGFYGGLCEEGLIQATAKPYIYDPLLATSWELAPDRTSYTFHLRKGVKFSDGTDFNAAAVKWNLDLAVATKRAELAPVTSVVVIDDYTVKVNLSQWLITLLSGLNQNIASMVSPTAVQKNGKDWAQLNPVGTGPFLMQEMVQSQYTNYVKNPNYWDPKLPYFDKVQIIAVLDPMTKQAMMLNGDADGVRELGVNEAKNLLATGKFNLEQGAMGNFIITANTADSSTIWSKPNMMMALEYALDKQTMVDALGKGFDDVSYGCIGGVWQVPGNNPGTTPRKYDSAKAAQLLKEAGYASGIKTSLELNQKFNSDFVPAIQAQLAKVGINVDINVVPDAAWQDRRLTTAAGNTLRFERGRGGPFDLIASTNNDLASNAITYPGVKRPDGWDTLLMQGLTESDGAKILTIVNQLEQKAYNMPMYIPVFIEYNINIWNKNLANDRGGVIVFAGNDAPGAIRYMYRVK